MGVPPDPLGHLSSTWPTCLRLASLPWQIKAVTFTTSKAPATFWVRRSWRISHISCNISPLNNWFWRNSWSHCTSLSCHGMSAKPKITCLGACRGPRTFPPCSSSTEPPFHQEGLLLALHIFYTRTEGVMIHFSSSSSFCSSIIILNLPILQKPQIPIFLNPQLKNPKNVRAALPSPPRCSAMIWEFHWFAAEPAMIPAHPPPLPGLSAGCIPTCSAAPWSHWTSWGYLRTWGPAGFHALTMAGSSNHTILAVVDTLW